MKEYVIQDAIPFNRAMAESLEKYGFTIYDTSTEREHVFDEIIETIEKMSAEI